MSPDPRSALQALADALPADATVPVPVAWLRVVLAGSGEAAPTPDTPVPDLTVAQVAARFGRAPSTVRGWIAAGDLLGAYHFRGRELRIPAASVLDFEARQRPAPHVENSRRREVCNGEAPDLGSWRKIAS